MYPYCYFGNEIKKTDEAGLSLNDLGVLRGVGVFDFLRTYNGKPFLFEEHFGRLQNSAKRLGIPLNKDKEEVYEAILELLKLNKCEEANIRIVLTGGPAEGGLKVLKPEFYILIEEFHPLPVEIYKKGGTLITSEYQRGFPEAKSTNYIQAATLQKKKEEAGAVEILYVSEGKVLEGATSSFLAFKGDTLITPREDVLYGTTRDFVLDLAKADYVIDRRDVLVDEIKELSEAFITATNKEIVPIVRIDNIKIADGKPGARTKKLMDKFRQAIELL